MKVYCVLFFILICFGCSKDKLQSNEPELASRLPRCISLMVSDHVSDRASAYTDANKIIEYGDYVFFVYLDVEYYVQIAKFEKSSKTLIDSYKLTSTVDNHGCPSIDIDDDGYIYVLYGGHAAEIILSKTTNPCDISSWHSEVIKIGDSELTYPVFKTYKGKQYLLVRKEEPKYVKGAVLYFMSRDGNSSVWNGKELFHGNHDRWLEEGVNLNTNSGYNRFYANMVIIDDKIHISFHCSEYIPRLNTEKGEKQNSYCVGYLFSDDEGMNWKTLSGHTLHKYPANPYDLDLVAGNPEPCPSDPYFQISNLVLDKELPYIMHVDSYNTYSRVILNKLRYSGGIAYEVYDTDFNSEYYVCGESALSMDKDGFLYMLLTVVNPEEFLGSRRYGAPSTRLVWMVCDKECNVIKSDFVLPSSGEPVWLPNLGRQNTDVQYFIFTEGNNASSSTNRTCNKLWFGWIEWK